MEGIGCSLVGLHQTGLVTISLHLLTRLVWCGGSIGVLPDWSGEKVKVISNQTSLVWRKYFGLTRLNRLKSGDKIIFSIGYSYLRNFTCNIHIDKLE